MSVFISYSKYDRDVAFTIKAFLEENNVRVWLDVISIKVSSQLLQELYDNIDKHDAFCLLLSPTSVASPWCLKEIEYARSKESLRFVPVIIRSCKIPASLENVVALDAREGLNHASVRSRLLRSLCGDIVVEDSILFTQLQQELLAQDQIVEEAERQLVDVKKRVAAVSEIAVRRLDVHIDVDSLPDDGTCIELRLKLDIWKVGLSIFIAVYQESRTWPERLGFEECEYTDFYRKKIPRVDVRFQWLDYRKKMDRIVTDDEHLAEFYMVFDGHDFKPGGTISMPTKFEIPCLIDLARHWSQFELFLHSKTDAPPVQITDETDIHLEVFGLIGDHSIRLYRSSHSFKQEILVRRSSIRTENNPIWKEVFLHGCDSDDTLKKARSYTQHLRAETLAALDDRETDWSKYPFSSLDERRRVAHALCSRGGTDHRIRSSYIQAFQRFTSALYLFNSLRPLTPISMFDLLAYVDCLYLMIETCLNQQRYQTAAQLGAVLRGFLNKFVQDNGKTADMARLLADASLLNAEIMTKAQRKHEALKELDMLVKTYRDLYNVAPSPKRRIAYIEALSRATRNHQSWELPSSGLVDTWTSAMQELTSRQISSKLLDSTDSNVLPAWLKPIELSAWPTVPIHNETLRYALRLPKRWIQKPLVRGTATQIEHVYWGNASQDAEWLCIDFMSNIQQGHHSHGWIDSAMLLAGLPVAPIHDNSDQGPKKRSWTYIGTILALRERLEADEAYGWIGMFEYRREYMMLGRVYALVVRRGKFAWKIVLSFNTAVLGSMEKTMLESNDHVRAGAILGELTLDDIPHRAEVATENANTSGMPTPSHEPNATPTNDVVTSTPLSSEEFLIAGRHTGTYSPSKTFPGFRFSTLPDFKLKHIYDYDDIIE